MLVVPAIDLRKGNVVRLEQGDFAREEVYAQDPLQVAEEWKRQGAQELHVVDLDGARKGVPQHLELVLKIVREVSLPVQLGGGMRTLKAVSQAFEGGIARVVLGTRAVEDPEFLHEVSKLYPGRVAVSIDVRDGKIAVSGWEALGDGEPAALVSRIGGEDICRIIFTSVTRDGTLTGPDRKGLREILRATQVPVLAAGGISSLDDIRKLRKWEKEGLQGVIVGKALYAGRFALAEAISIAQ